MRRIALNMYLVAALVFCACSDSARASVVFDNYFGPDNGTANGGPYFGYAPGFFGGPPEFAPVLQVAASFDVTQGDVLLSNVQATMMWFSDQITGNPINDGVTMRIHQSQGGLPGAVLGTYDALGPVGDVPSGGGPIATETPTLFDFSSQNLLLENGQTYWLSVEAVNNGFSTWASALDPNSDPLDPTILIEPGTMASNVDGLGWAEDSFLDRVAFRVNGQSVPGPSAALLLGLGGAFVNRRRRR